jgi:membrane protein DedA with SNARE-associated domain
VSFLERLAQALSGALADTSAYAPLILVFGSFVEYIFPPFPGDTLVILGAWYSVHGALSWPMSFLAVTAGAMAGALVDYRVGVALARGMDRAAHRRGPLSAERLHRVERGYRRYGAWFLIANRFLPGVRAFLFVAAGASGIPLSKVLLFGGLSAVLWNALLLAVGAALVTNLDQLLRLVAEYTIGAWIAMGSAAGLWVLFVAWRRRRVRS